MAHITFGGAVSGTTAAQFQAWGEAISDAWGTVVGAPVKTLTAVGGGTTTWSTIGAGARPTAIAAFYEIYQLPTAMTPASPVYIKLVYGSWSAGLHSLQAVVGTGFNGTDLSGTVATAHTLNAQSSGTSHYLACDGYGLVMVRGLTTSGTAAVGASVFVVDRHRTSAGTPLRTGTAVYSWVRNGPPFTQSQFDHVAGTVRNHVAVCPPCIATAMSSSNAELDTQGRTPLFPWWGVTANSRGKTVMIGSCSTNNLPDVITPIDVDDLNVNDGEVYLSLGGQLRAGGSGGIDPWTIAGDSRSTVAIWWGQ